jgi:dihydrofolate synthase/folylpolyglutamate synthase
MQYTQLHASLLSLPKFGNGIGLHRVQALINAAHDTFPNYSPSFIKITGSNGKGTTCAILNALFKALDQPIARFTSPHLFSFNERIAIDDEDISDSDLQDAFDWVLQTIERNQQPLEDFGGFEIYTAMAYYHFAKNNIYQGVFEVGIGGRYDPVRLIPGNTCALTSLDLEHTEILGDTLELIGYEKIDLCPRGGTLYSFSIADSDLCARLKNYARIQGVRLVDSSEMCHIENVDLQATRSRFDLFENDTPLRNLELNLSGQHNLSNTMVAVSAFQHYCREHLPQIEKKQRHRAMRKGLHQVQLKGRAEYFPGPPETYIDVGHTPQAVSQFVAHMKTVLKQRPILLVLGVSHNKAIQAIVEQLVQLADRVICTRANHRGADPVKIAEAVSLTESQVAVEPINELETALAHAQKQAKSENMTLVIAGGLFLAIEARHWLTGGDPKQLKFF